MKFKKIIFRPNARQMMAVASFQIMSASLFFILYYRASLWAPQAYKYHNEVRCGHDLYAFKDMLQKLDENHPSQLEVSSWPIWRFGDSGHPTRHPTNFYAPIQNQ